MKRASQILTGDAWRANYGILSVSFDAAEAGESTDTRCERLGARAEARIHEERDLMTKGANVLWAPDKVQSALKECKGVAEGGNSTWEIDPQSSPWWTRLRAARVSDSYGTVQEKAGHASGNHSIANLPAKWQIRPTACNHTAEWQIIANLPHLPLGKWVQVGKIIANKPGGSGKSGKQLLRVKASENTKSQTLPDLRTTKTTVLRHTTVIRFNVHTENIALDRVLEKGTIGGKADGRISSLPQFRSNLESSLGTEGAGAGQTCTLALISSLHFSQIPNSSPQFMRTPAGTEAGSGRRFTPTQKGEATRATGFGAWKTSFAEAGIGLDRAAKLIGVFELQCIQLRVRVYARGRCYRGRSEASDPKQEMKQGMISGRWSGE
ncbi:hypothetical protein BDV93DRAFT_513483 [Ceratobasidium sp. AG-I]|nr:hypothetical protein BDV93DRAFT_513483 [Ceratobasidium sp. AG-I]